MSAKITLENLDKVNDVYAEYEIPYEDRSAIFLNEDGTETFVDLQHYNEDTLQ